MCVYINVPVTKLNDEFDTFDTTLFEGQGNSTCLIALESGFGCRTSKN